MARFGLVGDLHGNSKWADYVLGEMGARNISQVFVLGDFGLWGGFAGVQYLDRLQESATENNLSVMAIPGNHENYDILEHYQAHAPSANGFYYLRERVLMCGKVNAFKMFGKQFAVAGGAVSIDMVMRLKAERQNGAHRTLWWPQEELTDAEEEQVKSFGKVDILLTHDCSNATPWKTRLKVDMNSQAHRERIDRVLKATQPEWHFHGHMHEQYEWSHMTGDDHWTQTHGLECDGDDNSWGVFDTDTSKFAYQGAGMHFRSLD